MRIFLSMMMVLSFGLATGGDAMAEGNNNQNCNASQLICIALDNLQDAEPDKVAHPCTTVGGDAGAWLCPGTTELPDPDNQIPLSASSGKRVRDVMGQ